MGKKKPRKKKKKAAVSQAVPLPNVPEIQRFKINEKEVTRIVKRIKRKVKPGELNNVSTLDKFKLIHHDVETLIAAQGGRHLLWQNQCTTQETLDEFGEWLAGKSEDSGIGERWKFGDSIYGRGVIAMGDMEDKSLIMKVPREVFFSSANALECPKYGHVFQSIEFVQLNNPSYNLVAFLLLHNADPDSPWRPYLNALPRDQGLILPSFCCTPDELKMIENLEICKKIVKLSINHMQLYLNLRDIFNRFNVYPSELRWYDYAWAAAMIMTRQSRITHGAITLIPGHDFVNSDQNGSCSSTYHGECLHLYAEAGNVTAGQEIFMDYGSRSSADTLHCNGFVYANNVYDCYRICLALDKDEFHKIKKIQCERRGILKSNEHFLTCEIKQMDGQLPETLLEFARIQALQTKTEILQYMKKASLGFLSAENETRALEMLKFFLGQELESSNLEDRNESDFTPMEKNFYCLLKVEQKMIIHVLDLVVHHLTNLKETTTETMI